MDDDVKRAFAEVLAELHALRLIVNEALSVALCHESNPDNAVILARQDIYEIIEKAEKEAIVGPYAEFRKWQMEKVRSVVAAQLDSIEKRVSRLKRDRAIH
jgi:rRNA maturation protein Rpf1